MIHIVKANQSLQRAFAVLEYLADHPGSRLKDVALTTKLAVPTASRFLGNLESLGYVWSENGRWRVGARLASLSRGFLAGHATAAIDSALGSLADLTGCTAFFVVCDRDEAVYVHRAAPSRAALVSAQRIGARAPLYCTGVGKVFLSERDDGAIRAYCSAHELRRYTAKTADNATELLRRVDLVRQQDWACDDEECEPGLRCLAVPVRDRGGRIRAGVSISGPAHHLDAAPTPDQLQALRHAASTIAPVMEGVLW
jgi:DNA-binding IclR family transcriptional regulator